MSENKLKCLTGLNMSANLIVLHFFSKCISKIKHWESGQRRGKQDLHIYSFK